MTRETRQCTVFDDHVTFKAREPLVVLLLKFMR